MRKFCFFIMMLIVAFALSCSKNDDGVSVDDSTEYIAFDSDLGDYVDYAIFGSDRIGYFYEFQDDDISGIPERLIIYDDNESALGISVIFDEDGLPKYFITDDFVMVLGNFEGTSFDAAIVSNDGSAYVYEDIETDFSWDEYTAELLNGINTRASTTATTIKWVNAAVGTAGCAASIAVAAAATGATGGVAAPVAIGLASVKCGSALVSIADAAGYVGDNLSMANNILGLYLNGGTGAAANAANALIVADVAISVHETAGNTSLAESCISTGIGPIKMTLSWSAYGDIDLHCIDPSNTHIYYSNKKSTVTGGWLDYDNTVGGSGSVENIYFDTPYDGEYQVYVKYYAQKQGVTSVDYNIAILVDGENKTSASTRTISGVGSIDEILTFEIEDGKYVTDTRSSSIPLSPIDWDNLPVK